MLAFFVQIASVAAASHGVDKVIAVGGRHSARLARTCGSTTRAREEGSDEESRSWQAKGLLFGPGPRAVCWGTAHAADELAHVIRKGQYSL